MRHERDLAAAGFFFGGSIPQQIAVVGRDK
jgi:hypothetical protein